MASVYYLFDDAIQVADDIVQKYSKQDEHLKDKHFAAIIIQRSYRGYVVRKNLQLKHQAAITLQKYIRGWLVRYYIPDRLQEKFDKICLETYHKMATKLQACWRGVLVRLEINIKHIMEEKRRAEERAHEFLGVLSLEDDEEEKDVETAKKKKEGKKEEDEDDDDTASTGLRPGQEILYIERIIQVMFDRHHLLSTQCHEGVLANKRELAEIEKVIAKLPWTNYMKRLRKIYNKYYTEEKNKDQHYIFTDKKLRKQEDLLRLRDTHNDKKPINMKDCVADSRKPFTLHSKVEQRYYDRSIFCQGKYFIPETNIVRTEDKSKNICDRDFKLIFSEIVKESKVPPYYTDFWYQECSGHNLL